MCIRDSYIIVDLEKCGVLTLFDEIRRYNIVPYLTDKGDLVSTIMIIITIAVISIYYIEITAIVLIIIIVLTRSSFTRPSLTPRTIPDLSS